MTKIKFFEENNGTQSSMRLMCFISLLMSIIVTITCLFISFDIYKCYVIALFVVSAFAPKAVQKFAEQKIL